MIKVINFLFSILAIKSIGAIFTHEELYSVKNKGTQEQYDLIFKIKNND